MTANSYPGAPLEPTGDPMVEGVGPATYADRADVPDRNIHGKPRIVPLAAASGFWLEERDPDPRGKPVTAADGVVAGTVSEVWVDTAEPQLRYLEVTLADGSRTVLLPAPFAKIDREGNVSVQAVLASHFAKAPGTRIPGQITRLEEDQIAAYFAGGYLYAEPSRLGPIL